MMARWSARGLAAASARRPWRTLGLWLVLLVVAGALQATLGGSFNDFAGFTNNPDSKQAEALIEHRIGKEPLGDTVVFRNPAATVDEAAFRAVVERTTADLLAMRGVVATASSYYQAKAAGDPNADKLVSKDRHTTIVPVTLVGTADELEPHGAAFIATAQGHRGNGFAVYVAGDLSGNDVYNKIANEDLAKAEQVGLPVALVVLVIVLVGLLGAVIPIALGLIAIFIAMGLTAVASHVVDISSSVSVMITMIGLAVGIDYALFVVSRYREERRHGHPKLDAIARAGGTAGKAVTFSGGTVVLALLGMFLIPITVFHSLATGAILAVLVAVLAAQTLVPALLRLFGDGIDFPLRRRYGPDVAAAQARRDHETIHRGLWGRITRGVMARPVRALVVALAILIGAALPVVGLKTGQADIASLPGSDVKTGYQIIAKEFYAGTQSPVRIVVAGSVDNPAVTTGVARLTAALATDNLYGPPTVTRSRGGDLTVVAVPMGIDPNAQRAYDAIDRLRGTTIPTAFGGLAGHVHVGGESAGNADFNAALRDYTPRVFAFVLGLSFLLLLLAFRSVVVPLTSILINLLSVGAAYGLLVAVFQHGVGADLLGVRQTENITAWLPIFLFCVLFGLSMDYHVFLLSRIREHYDQTGRNAESVAVGLQATGKLITGAALIMVAVFGSFAAGRLEDIQQMGFGLAAAIFLDATIVRSILVPATMKLLGNANWYLPRWLGWLPDLRIDGAAAERPAVSSPMPGLQPAPWD